MIGAGRSAAGCSAGSGAFRAAVGAFKAAVGAFETAAGAFETAAGAFGLADSDFAAVDSPFEASADAVPATNGAFGTEVEDGFAAAGGLAYMVGKGGTAGTMLILSGRLGGGDALVAARLEEKAAGLARVLGGVEAARSDDSDDTTGTRRSSAASIVRGRPARCATGVSVIAGDVCVAREADPFGVKLTDPTDGPERDADPEPASSEPCVKIGGVTIERGAVVGGVTRGGANIIGGIKLVESGMAVGVTRGDGAAGLDRVAGSICVGYAARFAWANGRAASFV